MGLTTNSVNEPASRRPGPIFATSMFLNNHEPGLSNLVDIIDDDRAINAVCDLAANHAQVSPRPDLSRPAIGIILDALQRVSASGADRLARHWNIDIGGATLWYGARLTDLHGRFEASP